MTRSASSSQGFPSGDALPVQLGEWAAYYVQWLSEEAKTTVTLRDDPQQRSFVDAEESELACDGAAETFRYRPVLLMTRHAGEWVVAAVAVLDRNERSTQLRVDALDAIAYFLLESRDVGPLVP